MSAAGILPRPALRHYVFFNLERRRISEPSFKDAAAWEGAQLKYTWRELEPQKDRYDFRAVREDLKVLDSRKKRLFLQFQDVSFGDSIVNVPRYLTEEAVYSGGADRQYRFEGEDESRAVPEGWVARRWDPAVRARFQKLLAALGKEFDAGIEGVNLPETAVSFGESGRWFPRGFTFEKYRDAVIENMKALKAAFPKSVTMQYANFMPGEWLPENDRSYLRSVYREARRLRVGVGGPDLLPYKRGQMNHAYRFLREWSSGGAAGAAPAGIAVQWGNYEYINPQTGKRVTIPDLVRFADEYLRVRYIFWCMQEPFYSQELLPFIRRSARGGREERSALHLRGG